MSTRLTAVYRAARRTDSAMMSNRYGGSWELAAASTAIGAGLCLWLIWEGHRWAGLVLSLALLFEFPSVLALRRKRLALPRPTPDLRRPDGQ